MMGRWLLGGRTRLEGSVEERFSCLLIFAVLFVCPSRSIHVTTQPHRLSSLRSLCALPRLNLFVD